MNTKCPGQAASSLPLARLSHVVHTGTFTLCKVKVTEQKCEMILERKAASSRKSRICSDWNLIENTIQTSLEIQR